MTGASEEAQSPTRAASPRSTSGPWPSNAALLGFIALGVAIAALLIAIRTGITASSQDTEQSRISAEQETPPEEADSASKASKYSGPNDVTSLVKQITKSVVLINCGDGSGTGWIINTLAAPNLRPGRNRGFDAGGSALAITAQHVIAECESDSGSLEAYVGQMPVDVTLLNWSRKHDIALLAINSDEPGLETTVMVPPASWAMSVGFPWEFDFPVPLIGRAIDRTGNEQYVDMAIQPGSSGSPIVNHEGRAIGTAVATLTDPDADLSVGWTISVPNDVLCLKLFNCSDISITSKR